MQIFKNSKYKKMYAIIAIFIALMLLAGIFSLSGLYDTVLYELGGKASCKIRIFSLTPGITSICAESRNEFAIKAIVTYNDGRPAAAAKVVFSEANGKGTFKYLSGRTSGNGEIYAIYSPPEQSDCLKEKPSEIINISAGLHGVNINDTLSMKLVRVPIVFLHGYKASPSIFNNFSTYMQTAGFLTSGMDYDSGSGVSAGAVRLNSYLEKLPSEYLKKGILSNRFDIIAHSMGGLVARYYTCGTDYAEKGNVSKIIFLSTPQKGSPFASLGRKYYKDRGILDLIPESELYTKIFPSFLNRGLNSEIRTASILGQYDEVVSLDSASLEQWGIKTELFHVGENNFTVDKLLTGRIVEASNHKLVLDNLKIYKRVEEMLLSELPYPKKIH